MGEGSLRLNVPANPVLGLRVDTGVQDPGQEGAYGFHGDLQVSTGLRLCLDRKDLCITPEASVFLNANSGERNGPGSVDWRVALHGPWLLHTGRFTGVEPYLGVESRLATTWLNVIPQERLWAGGVRLMRADVGSHLQCSANVEALVTMNTGVLVGVQAGAGCEFSVLPHW